MVKLLTVLELVQELSDSDRSELASMLADDRKDMIPVGAFAGKYSGLESICVFLKDKKGMRFADMARMLNRSQVTVRITYNNAKKKKFSSILLLMFAWSAGPKWNAWANLPARAVRMRIML